MEHERRYFLVLQSRPFSRTPE